MSSQHSSVTATVANTLPVRRSWLETFPCTAWFQLLVIIIAAGVVISRRPDAVWNAQFWAEDGVRWYAEAYQYGIHALLIPSTGYYVTLPRVVAFIGQWVPMSRAPLLFNVVGLAVQVLPVSLFLSPRYTFAGPVPRRMLFSFVYLALPNSAEINVSITNAQWHLALLGCMVLLAGSSRSRSWKVFDLTVTILLALTGPFALLLAPLAALIYWKRRERWALLAGGVLGAGALLQAVSLARNPRSAAALGATWYQFVRIAGHQFFLASLFGSTGFWLPDPQPRWYFGILVLTFLAGASVLVYALWTGPFELKLFIIFSLELFVAALASPMGEWRYLHFPGAAGRYWFFPMMCFLASLFWLAFGKGIPRIFKWVAVALLISMSSGIIRDWRYPRLVDYHFARYARECVTAPRNTRCVIPINPPGWKMILVTK